LVTETLTLEQAERDLCARSFLDFLDHVKVVEPPPGRGIIPFAKWDHLLEVVELFSAHRLISILKARQIGLSWLLAAYACWTALYHKGANVMLFSQGELEAKALLQKVRQVHDELPPHLQGMLSTNSTTEMRFEDIGSKVTALPSTEKAGRGETGTLVIQDEADFHEYADTNYAALKPTIDAGGQLIQVSTSNKKNMSSLFKGLYRGAPDNGFCARFYSWAVRPERDQNWYDRIRREAPDTADMNADLYMEQEYPRAEEEALAPSRILSAFDADVLEAMMDDTCKPVETTGILTTVNIYQKPSVGKRYMAATDSSHGVGADFGVSVVMDATTGMVVADIIDQYIEPEVLASETVDLLEKYNNPIWAIEDNEWGILAIRRAQELEYPNLYERLRPGKTLSGASVQVKRPGWHTDEKTRYILWGELIQAIKDRLIVIPNRDGLVQFTSVIRNPEKNGRIEGMVGAHDDYPLAVGIAWQMRKEAYTADREIPMRNRRKEATQRHEGRVPFPQREERLVSW
jgi:hypothetical protein